AVTDSTPNTMQVRALVTAKDADDIWTVRVTVRERMMHWLTEDHPYALPRINTASATPPPGKTLPGPRHDQDHATTHPLEPPHTGTGRT
ncbi:mechanosensitive ion channel family protein, partial [Streptomyces sp. NPDC057636]